MKRVPTRLHQGTCFHCGATGAIPADFYTCCWNPTGCRCNAVVRP